MKNIPTFSEFVNEALGFEGYNLGIKDSWQYEKKIGSLVKDIPGIKEYDSDASDGGKTAVSDYATGISIHQYGNKDMTKEIIKALKGVDNNLDLDSITNNFKAGPDARSKNDQDSDIYVYSISKKKGWWDFKRNAGPSQETVLTYEIVFNLLDKMASVSTTQHELADIEWPNLESFLAAAKDHMSASNYTKFSKDVKKQYPKLK